MLMAMMKLRRKILWVVLVVIALTAVAYQFQPYRVFSVHGDSMFPTLKNGDWMLVDTAAYRFASVRNGDVVVLRHGDTIYVKRVVAVPGDEILMVRSPEASAVLIPLRMVIPAIELCRNHTETRLERLIIADDEFYATGDNRTASFDSRDFGPIPRNEIIGRVVMPHLR